MPRLKGPFSDLFFHGSLIHELAKREILGRYRGASFGLMWALISPFLMLGVYTLAFGNILRSHWPSPEGSEHSFALILFVGLFVHAFLAECINQSPHLVVGNPSYVKKVVFPLEILPWPMVLSALFHLATSAFAYVVLALLSGQPIPWTAWLFPVVVFPLVLVGLGMAWALAALGVYFRDINQMTGVVSTALLFTSTAIIPISAIPEKMRWLFFANPLSFIIDQVRVVVMWGEWPDWQGLAIYAGVALLVCHVGYGIFMAMRRGFADVL